MTDLKFRFRKVRQVLEYYMENHGFNAESWADLANMTKVFIEVMGHRNVDQLMPEHFVAYGSLRRKGKIGKRKAKSDGTIRRELQHLQTAIHFCARARVINPATVPHIPMPDAPPPRDRWLNKDEIAAVMQVIAGDKVQDRVKTFVMIARFTAARKSMIENLQWDQVNFSTSMIEYGKHEKKLTKKRKPMVPMHSELRLFLEQLKKRSKTRYVLENNHCIRAALDVVAKHADIDGLTPHVFRHTWATHASMNGVSLLEIARVLGDTIKTVEKTYAKFQPDYLRGAIEQAVL